MATLTKQQQSNPLFAKADLVAKNIYNITRRFPKDEQYGMTSQIRRAGLSVILNIIEGFARQSQAEYKRFLKISLGSAKETEYLLAFAYEQGYCSEEDFGKVKILIEEVNKILWATIQKLK